MFCRGLMETNITCRPEILSHRSKIIKKKVESLDMNKWDFQEKNGHIRHVVNISPEIDAWQNDQCVEKIIVQRNRWEISKRRVKGKIFDMILDWLYSSNLYCSVVCLENRFVEGLIFFCKNPRDTKTYCLTLVEPDKYPQGGDSFFIHWLEYGVNVAAKGLLTKVLFEDY